MTLRPSNPNKRVANNLATDGIANTLILVGDIVYIAALADVHGVSAISEAHTTFFTRSKQGFQVESVEIRQH